MKDYSKLDIIERLELNDVSTDIIDMTYILGWPQENNEEDIAEAAAVHLLCKPSRYGLDLCKDSDVLEKINKNTFKNVARLYKNGGNLKNLMIGVIKSLKDI